VSLGVEEDVGTYSSPWNIDPDGVGEENKVGENK